MNENVKKKWAGRSTYIALALLLVAILTITIIAIATTVAKNRDDTPPIDDPNINEPGDDQQTGTTPDDDNDDNKEPEDNPQPQPIYKAPCAGGLQKDYSEDVLVFSPTMNDHRVHLGIDISGKVGDPVYAFSDGTIEKVFSDPFMGKTIVIDHGNGLKSYYMNLAENVADGIEAGKKVTAGTLIGAIGETAIIECAESPHLHFELRLEDKRIDPTTYITIPSMSETEPEYEG